MKFENEFIIDAEKRVVGFAGKEFRHYHCIRKVSDVLGMFELYGNQKGQGYKDFTQKYGITPTNFKRCFNAIMRKVWVEPVEKHAMRYAFNSNRRINADHLRGIWEVKDKIEQCEKDGIENVIPFVVYTGLDPKELKGEFGKSYWKKITKQSMTRNKYMAKISRREDVSNLFEFPSSLLKKGFAADLSFTEAGKWVLDTGMYDVIRKDVNTKYALPSYRKLENLYRDTKSMSQQLGKGFSSKWLPEKMQEKHDEYTRLIMLKKYSPEKIEHLKDFKLPAMEHKGFVAELCDSPLLIKEEGEAMHHCVGMYLDQVLSGSYLIYSIKKDGARSSTLGIRIKDGVYIFNQHYGYCNGMIEDKYEGSLAGLILNELNKDYISSTKDTEMTLQSILGT